MNRQLFLVLYVACSLRSLIVVVAKSAGLENVNVMNWLCDDSMFDYSFFYLTLLICS